MKNQRIAAIAAGFFLAALMPLQANAAGCTKGAVVGGVGGHMAGHHAVVGAAAGCAIGHHEAAKKQKVADRDHDRDRDAAKHDSDSK